jgi:hypothetical protein
MTTATAGPSTLWQIGAGGLALKVLVHLNHGAAPGRAAWKLWPVTLASDFTTGHGFSAARPAPVNRRHGRRSVPLTARAHGPGPAPRYL